MKGYFITFEGPEGAGKTTQINRIKEFLTQYQVPCIVVREPGGTAIGNLIRNIILDSKLNEMELMTEVLLYAASRAQLVEQVIRPSLTNGTIVLCDRYIDSSIAYQGYGAMLALDEVMQINQIATKGLSADRTYLLDIPVELGQQRLYIRGLDKDRIELREKAFHIRVREGYIALAESDPKRFRIISADKEIDEVFNLIIRDLSLLLGISW